MKKVFATILTTVLLFSTFSVFAENEETQAEPLTEVTESEISAEKEEKNILKIEVSMLPCMKVIDSVAVIELYSKDGTKLGTREEWIGGITEKFTLEFEVPSVKSGDSYILKLSDGLTYLKYYDDSYGKGDEIELTLYGYIDENQKACVADAFALGAFPMYEHVIVPYVNGRQIKAEPSARLINNTAMIPVRAIAEAMGLAVRYDEVYNSVVCSLGEKELIFNVGTTYATLLGEDTNLPEGCAMIEDTVFVPVRPFAEALECNVEALDFGDHIDVCIGISDMINEYMKKIPVNEWGLTSQTEYLVWIDKSDYRVRVYKGSKGLWNEIKSFPCAIGAPNSPTITGSYEYQYRMKQWDYFDEGFYVAPCLVFYGNYALHSTLLSYKGGLYDDRVGVMISHGCVRLHKEDIDWLSDNLPLNSRIYITE